MDCTVKKYLKITKGSIADYKPLARFHYRDCTTGPTVAIYKIIDTHPRRSQIEPTVGVIIYSMPTLNVALRNVATGGLFSKLGKNNTAADFINANIRRISRVVIEPRYRGLGLAHKLIEKTMPLLKSPYIESLAVMGKVNPFFKRAGMLEHLAAEPVRCAKLKQALSAVGIDEDKLVDIGRTHRLIDSLSGKRKIFIEKYIKDFLAAYGKRARAMENNIERTEYILSRLSDRPAYYLWRNADIEIKI